MFLELPSEDSSEDPLSELEWSDDSDHFDEECLIEQELEPLLQEKTEASLKRSYQILNIINQIIDYLTHISKLVTNLEKEMKSAATNFPPVATETTHV